jgi:hypothetical protein
LELRSRDGRTDATAAPPTHLQIPPSPSTAFLQPTDTDAFASRSENAAEDDDRHQRDDYRGVRVRRRSSLT